jgi:hypothetical protein
MAGIAAGDLLAQPLDPPPGFGLCSDIERIPWRELGRPAKIRDRAIDIALARMHLARA